MADVMEFQAKPRPESIARLVDMKGYDSLTVGVTTITHREDGLKVKPHRSIGLALQRGELMWSFDFPPSFARSLAERLVEMADYVESAGDV